jgi:YD repeat-containing protein
VIAQGQAKDGSRPRPGKPEGTLPNLEEVKRESQLEREPPAPIASTIRSPKVPQQPWNGRRVGDPLPGGPEDRPVERGHTHRAHPRKRVSSPPTVLDDQFVQNFFTWTVLRTPTSNDATFWNDQLRVAYAQDQTSVKLAAVALGKTLFESAEYLNRNRDNHWYVYDLYKTFLMRDPDSSGWAYWESVVPANGRENVRRAFEEAPEFAGILASIVPNGSATANAASLISALVEPRNQPTHELLARDVTWSVPLLSLAGRGGLDLGLALSYSSMVWTRSGPYIHFDEDNGFPSPGFRLGFPVIQRKVFDAQTAKNAFLLITPAGQRVELRQVGSSNTYEAADSSYIQLTDNSPNLLLRTTDGTQLSFLEIQNEFRCWQVKDRNGNYLTIASNALGRITNITDTLGRVINFSYDSNANLISITQAWNGQPSHQWVSFGWGTRTMQSSFSGAGVVGIANGSSVPVITQVSLNDTSYFTFDYNNSLQVNAIRNYFGAVERNATTFTYQTPASDVPRLLDSRVSAQNWTGMNGVPAQVITQYSVAGDGACVLTAPDGTVYKEYYGAGWQRGLTTQSEIWSGGVRQKWTTTAWTQDNTSVAYEANPRVTETNVYDASGNRRRTVIDYGQYAQYGLPYSVKEYAGDGATVIRQAFTDYNLTQTYLDRRIIGLVSQVQIKNVSSYESKITYDYDDPSRLQLLPAAATQHDSSYNTSFTTRGNVTAVSRWDVNDINNASKKLTTYANYFMTGSSGSSTDPAGHQNSISYTDAFSDSVNRNTFAYPTTMTDADGFSSYVQYNFDLGATTRTQSPAPAGQSQGAIHTMSYNSLGQLELVTTANNGAYKRFWYGSNYAASYTTVNNVADDLYSIAVTDGLGRVFGTFGNHPGSVGGYYMIITIYDQMGRAVKVSNPTEIYGSWAPAGDDAAGIYYTQQTYDWNGRPLLTTHPDGTSKEVSYVGCGCAGGEVVTLTDEGTINAGVAKRRQQRIYSDSLGRTVKNEALNWQGGSVYSTTVNTYNARDQVIQVREYAGAEGTPTYQDTTMTYDGYGRLKTRHVPEQNVGASTTWDYNPDDTLQKVTDGRGATTTLNYSGNNRKLVSSVTHTLSVNPPINTSFTYDASGNRVSMSDALGSVEYQYDQLSRLKAEIRTITGVTNPNAGDGRFKLSYDYNLAGALKKITDATNMSIAYGYDSAGRINGVTGADALYASVSQYASSFSYRAWGALKDFTDGTNQMISRRYNPRLQTSQFSIGALVQNFDYFNDGRIKFLHNLQDGNFDRSFSYDQQGRLIAAASGGAARQDGGAVPYNQTFGYDAFSNLTARSTNTWNQFTDSDSAVYVNNRRNGWGYDSDGRNIAIEDRNYYFDAAGRTSRMEAPMWISALGSSITKVMDSSYDGDGQKVKEGIWDYYNYDPAVTRYYLRSSVLKGAIIAEIDGAGQKQAGYVYAGERVLAKQTENQVSWKHTSPAGTSEYNSTPFGSYARNEFDPFGSDVTLSATAPPENPPAPGEIGEGRFGGIMDSRYSDIFDTNGCVVDGMPESCTVAAAMVNFGTGNSTGLLSTTFNMASFAQSLPLRFAPTTALTTPLNVSGTEGRTTYETVWNDEYQEWVPNTPTAYSGTAPIVISLTLASALPVAQNSTLPIPSDLRDRIDKIVKKTDTDCRDYIKKLLDAVNPKNDLYSDDPLKLFDRVNGEGGFQLRNIRSKEAGEASFSGGKRVIYIRPIYSYSDSRLDEHSTNGYSITVLNELMHHARKSGVYEDRPLAEAAFKLLDPQQQAEHPLPQSHDVDINSSYFHSLLNLHCHSLTGE